MIGQKTKTWIAGLLIFCGVLVGLLYLKKASDKFNSLNPDKNFYEDSLKFDSEKWKQVTDYVEGIRPFMLHDLMTNYLKSGMDTIQIINLLGEPLPWGYDDRIFYYELGYYRESDPVYLMIELDEKGKLVKSTIEEI